MRKVRSRAPLRLGIAGGGTDVSPYCDEHTGYVLNATIDRYVYCTIEEIAQPQVIFQATDRATRHCLPITDFPFDLNNDLCLLKATYNRMIAQFNDNQPIGLKITSYCDSPIGSGLGTSSTLVVSMIKAFEAYLQLGLDDYQIAHLAYEIERIDCQLQGGQQDQYSATFGGFNFMEFYGGEKVLVNPLRIRNWIVNELESSIILHYTGVSRASADIIESQISSVSNNKNNSLEHMHQIKESAFLMKESLLKGEFSQFVECLNSSWEHKRKTAANVSNSNINEAIEQAKLAGALAAKVSGAGGGGFIMYFVPPEKRHAVIEQIQKRGEWVSNCHFSNEGSQCWIV